MTDPSGTGATAGDVRLTGAGKVEVFDGTRWVPYERLPAVDPGPVVRGEDAGREPQGG